MRNEILLLLKKTYKTFWKNILLNLPKIAKELQMPFAIDGEKKTIRC